MPSLMSSYTGASGNLYGNPFGNAAEATAQLNAEGKGIGAEIAAFKAANPTKGSHYNQNTGITTNNAGTTISTANPYTNEVAYQASLPTENRTAIASTPVTAITNTEEVAPVANTTATTASPTYGTNNLAASFIKFKAGALDQDDPTTSGQKLYDFAKSQGITAEQLDQAMGWAPGHSAQWATDHGLASFSEAATTVSENAELTAASLPANWSTFTPQQKANYFNTNGITPAKLAESGATAEEIAQLRALGYNVQNPETTTSQGTALTASQIAAIAAANLPADWSTYTPTQKALWFNEKGMTPAQLAAAGVTTAELAALRTAGYTIQNAGVAGTVTATAGQVAQTAVNPNQTTSGLLNSLLAEDSPYLQRARALSMEKMNERGLASSSIAQGAGTAAAIDAALGIAGPDAQIYQQTALSNTASQNAANLQASQLGSNERVANANIEAQRALQLNTQQYQTLTNGSGNALAIMTALQTKLAAIQMDKEGTADAKRAAAKDAINIAKGAMALIAHSTGDVSFNNALDFILDQEIAVA